MKMRHFDPERDLNEVIDLARKTMRDMGMLRVTAAQISTQSSLPSYNDVVMQGFGAWPTLVLGVPFVARYVVWRHRTREYKERLPRIELLKKIFEDPQGFSVRHIDTQLLASLGGTIDEEADTPDGELYLLFPEVELEMAAAREIRSAIRE